jgi:hypothetical protein
MPEGLPQWIAFWTIFGLGDYWLSRHGLSQSQVARRTFHTDSTAGKLTFTVALTGATCALWRHILKGS